VRGSAQVRATVLLGGLIPGSVSVAAPGSSGHQRDQFGVRRGSRSLERGRLDRHHEIFRPVSHLREPILWQRPGAPLELPDGKRDTLILQDVAALGPVEQRRLIAWLDETGQFTQVVSTTTIALFPLVVDGLFDSALYYRLNVLLMHVDADTLAAARAPSGNPAVPRSTSRLPDPPVEARPS
jgi:Sigma-54 interaction domain